MSIARHTVNSPLRLLKLRIIRQFFFVSFCGYMDLRELHTMNEILYELDENFDISAEEISFAFYWFILKPVDIVDLEAIPTKKS